jgi:hypothetical protein
MRTDPAPHRGTTQIDLVKFEKGYVPQVGVKLDKAKVQHVFDVKTCDRLRMTEEFQNFLQRIKILTGVEIVWAPQVLEKWSVFRKVWETNKRVLRGIPWAKTLGAASVATVIFSLPGSELKFDSSLQDVMAWRMANDSGSDAERMAARGVFYTGLADLLNTVSIDPIQAYGNLLGLEAVMMSNSNPDFEFDDEYDGNN